MRLVVDKETLEQLFSRCLCSSTTNHHSTIAPYPYITVLWSVQ